jgi:hypothetical protein
MLNLSPELLNELTVITQSIRSIMRQYSNKKLNKKQFLMLLNYQVHSLEVIGYAKTLQDGK